MRLFEYRSMILFTVCLCVGSAGMLVDASDRPESKSAANVKQSAKALEDAEESVSVEEIIKPEHAKLLSEAEGYIREQVKPHLNDSDTEVAETAREMLEILDLPRKDFPANEKLLGKWKVRSLQANDLGAYRYPYFPCEILAEGPSGLVFHKSKGSQRRIGLLLPENKETNSGVDEALQPGLTFLGGSYYSDELPRGYSALQNSDDAPTSDDDRDSVGRLHAISPNHLIVIFAPLNSRSEVYELVRR